MTSLPTGNRKCLPSIDSVWVAIESYFADFCSCESHQSSTADTINPLDALILTLLVDFLPDTTKIVDTCLASTSGASTVTLLNTRDQKAITTCVEAMNSPLIEKVCNYATEHGKNVKFQVQPMNAAGRMHSDRKCLILIDCRNTPRESCLQTIQQLTHLVPSSSLAVMGADHAGNNGMVDELILHLPASHQIRLLRDVADSLHNCSLCLISPRNDSDIHTALTRIQHLYTGNVQYIDLLWKMNEDAITASGANCVAMGTHPSASPVMQELQSLRERLAQEKQANVKLRQRLERTEAALAVVSPEHRLIQQIAMGLLDSDDIFESELDSRENSRSRKLRRVVAPDGSWRHRTITRGRKAFSMWKTFGTLYIIRRVLYGPVSA